MQLSHKSATVRFIMLAIMDMIMAWYGMGDKLQYLNALLLVNVQRQYILMDRNM